MNHHAILLVGDREAGLDVVHTEIGVSREEVGSHPDVHILCYERFGIDEARAVKNAASGLPVKAALRSFVICCASLTGEAQNALLKLFEEPPATARFFLIVHRADMLLPTLRSRMHMVSLTHTEGAQDVARTFLALSMTERLAYIASKMKEEDASWVRTLLNGLEEYVFLEGASYAKLKELAAVRRYTEARGSSPKMLLEHLALSL